jgi:outer membrane protein TolC
MFAMCLSGCVNKFNNEFHSDKLNSLSARVERVLNNSSDTPEQIPGVVLLDELIDVPELNEFIQIALLENPELQQSIQALKITQLQSKVVNAQRKPTANLNFIGSKSENETSNAYSTELAISWELDLLGRLARATA